MIHVAAPEPAGLVSASHWSVVTPEPAGRVLTNNSLQNITWEETKTKAVDAVLFLTGASPRVQGEEARSEEEAVDNQVCIRGPIADGCFPDPFRSALPPLYHWYLAGV
eukprot:scaffold1922_cov291-Chaetoceros_neogracile.AAC.18